jgi:hypothetical protein
LRTLACQCRLPASEQLIEDPADRVQIGTGVRRITEQFGSGVALGVALGRRRATMIRWRLIEGHRPIDITQVSLATFVQPDVGRRNVPVNEPTPVDLRERTA